jgi:hypothetical protein
MPPDKILRSIDRFKLNKLKPVGDKRENATGFANCCYLLPQVANLR